jgi:hypothetical protein
MVKALDVGGFTRLFADRPMTLGWENRGVRFPKIGVADSTLAIYRRQGVPQTLGTSSISWSHKTADNQACFSIQRQPYPLFIALGADK